MAVLELVVGGVDSGSEAIKKLDRNIKAVNLELQDVDVDISDYIVNNLTSTDASKALGAPQGKALAEQISILSTDLGNKTTLTTTVKTSAVLAINEVNANMFKYTFASGSINNIKTFGQYYGFALTDMPYGDVGGYIKVYRSHLTGYVEQEILGTTSLKKSYRILVNDVWQPWQTVATTDKIDISAYLVNGWVQHFGVIEINKVGSLCSLAFVVKDGIVTSNTNIFSNLPTTVRPSVQRVILVYSVTDKLQYQAVVEPNGTLRIGGSNNLPTGQIVFSLSYTM